MTGFVNLPDLKIALLEIRHQPLASANARPGITHVIVSEGGQGGDLGTPNAHINIEFLQADFDNLSARMRENGENVVYTLERAMPPAERNICLADADFGQVVDLYGQLMNRSVLCHPQLHPAPISVAAEAQDRNAVIERLGSILEQQTQTATIMDGDTFAVLAPTNLVKSVTAALEKIPCPSPAGPKQSSGSINFVAVPTPLVLRVYGDYIGRKLVLPNNVLPFSLISFHNQTPLTRPEIIYALDVLFSWQGLKASFIDQDSFKMVPL
jgi:hypothetical protein